MFIIQCKVINKSIVWTRDAKRSSRTAAALMSNKKGPISSIITVDRSFLCVEKITRLRPSIPFSIYSGMRSSFDLHAECMLLCCDVGATQLSVFS